MLRIGKILSKNRNIVIVVAIVIIFILWYFLLFARFSGQISELSAEVIRLNGIKNNDIPRLEKKLKREQHLLNSYASILPKKKEVPALLTKICLVVKNCDVNLLSFNPQNEEIKEICVNVPVRLRTRSTFGNLSCVFSNFLNMRKVVDVKSFSLTNPKLQKDGTVLIDGEFIIMTYYLKE